jgi:hypothetical protein
MITVATLGFKYLNKLAQPIALFSNLKLMLISLFSLILISSFLPKVTYAWHQQYELPPIIPEIYTSATAPIHNINVNYSIWTTPHYMPIEPLFPGQTLRLRVLAPPGTIEISIYGESEQWQGQKNSQGWFIPGTYPLVGSFYYEGEFCPFDEDHTHCNGKEGSFVHPNQLHPVWAGLNEPIYDHRTNPMITEPRYLYFVIYHPSQAWQSLNLSRLSIRIVIQDTQAYNTWQSHLQSSTGQARHQAQYPMPLSYPQRWRDWECCK